MGIGLQTHQGNVIVRGSPEKLLDMLVQHPTMPADPNFVSDFFLMFRTFCDSLTVARMLLKIIQVWTFANL
jgi:hypothetical protein